MHLRNVVLLLHHIQNPAGSINGIDGVITLLRITELGDAEIRLEVRRTYYYLTLSVVLLSICAIHRIVHSLFGTIRKSIRESPERAAAPRLM